jgi:hypothetical protein
MCLIQDDIKVAYHRHGDALTQQVLDARNSESRPPTVFEMLADRWNDPSFNPIAPASACHEEFTGTTNCSHNLVAMIILATPQKVKDSLASLCAILTQIIGKWEVSGQGEGGHHGSDEATLGSLVGRPAFALSGRADFLNGRPPYTLYFWELAHEHQILQNSIQRLDDDSGALDASSVPSTIRHGVAQCQGQPESATKQDTGDIKALSDSICVLAEQKPIVLI